MCCLILSVKLLWDLGQLHAKLFRKSQEVTHHTESWTRPLLFPLVSGRTAVLQYLNGGVSGRYFEFVYLFRCTAVWDFGLSTCFYFFRSASWVPAIQDLCLPFAYGLTKLKLSHVWKAAKRSMWQSLRSCAKVWQSLKDIKIYCAQTWEDLYGYVFFLVNQFVWLKDVPCGGLTMKWSAPVQVYDRGLWPNYATFRSEFEAL